MGLRITTWNVNGIRNPFGYQPWSKKRTFQAMFEILEADIVIMQETKIQRKDLHDDMVLVPGWDVFFSLPKHKKGYSGVAIYTRNAKCCPIRAEEGITGILPAPNSSTSFRDLPEAQQIGGYPRPDQLPGEVDEATLDSEGRCVVLEFQAFVLIGTYSPATRDSSRNDFRLGYLNALDARVRNLVAAGKQVILTGDLNVIREEMDTCNVREALRKEGMSVEEWMGMPSRRLFNHLVFDGRVTGKRDEGREAPVLYDLTRIFHPTRLGMFTCWETKRNMRPANNGSRIDYILCSAGIKDWFTGSDIQEGLMGSDHCPVYANLADTVKVDGRETSVLGLMNPVGMFRDGERLREWSAKDLLPLSAKLIPEFDRRRNIRDMFMKTTSGKPSSSPASNAFESHSQSLVSEDLATQDPESSQQETLESSASQVSIQSSLSEPPASQTRFPLKRASDTAIPARGPPKRTKANEPDPLSKQSTLTGFFKPKQSPSKPPPAETDTVMGRTKNRGAAAPRGDLSHPSPLGVSKAPPHPAGVAATADAPPLPAPSPSPLATSSTAAMVSGLDTAERVFDPIEVKESWSKFNLGKRVVPRCEHGEPCIILQTKKPGVNCGRSFYICARPLGQSGEKEKGTEWRCGTFIWSSDWKRDQS
ncbi:endonuclease/Exonuclease/phosphatase [Colletotrichum navitas]|uniref:DNA-(apurinic or apyrimidinic site) endonuclease 2 n=1 Tax=Colletotrichum navitas TaxID=681940 RepID=A0AAD8PUS1_9PEZI|nr:endonuclease/Exonuclease/phosphatase [Colletotrichum navitas]KAK1580352.1 endonuclease/Exonuclease/phosphatase [Colletotrichum navitas]